jgi:hypothetical protein
MSSTTFTVRVELEVKMRLEKLAKSTGRTRSFLAAEALSEYLDANEWQVAGRRLMSCPTACTATPSRFCVCITALGVGPRAFSRRRVFIFSGRTLGVVTLCRVGRTRRRMGTRRSYFCFLSGCGH